MILGRNHPLLRRIRQMRKSAEDRRAEGVLLAEGLHLGREALSAGCEIDTVLYDPRARESAEGASLLEAVEARGIEKHEVAESVMQGLQDARSPQPLLTLVRTRPLEERPWRTSPAPLVVVCDGIQDPGNLGTILRSADAAGAAALFVTGSSADPHHPRTVRASMGSLFRIPVERRDLDLLIPELKERGLATIGTRVGGGEDYRLVDLSVPCALVLGSEGAGLDENVLGGCDRNVTIPLHEGVESLSVSAAAAVLLFEAARQRA